MRIHTLTSGRRLSISRRQFVKGLTAGGVISGLHWGGPLAFGEAVEAVGPRTPEILTGNHFELSVDQLPVNFTGKKRTAVAVNGSVPGPTLRWREGEVVAVTNRLKTPTSIHWHGIRLPTEMDGVPGLSFAGIAPGQRFVYRIPVVQSGTYWYHSHSGGQEQTGLTGGLIIEPKAKDPIAFDREYVVMLTDWTDTDPMTVVSNLKQDSDYYNYRQRTAGTFFSDVKKNGLRPTLSERLMWGRMNMAPTDILDVTGSTYTYLLNGNTPKANWTGLFKPGERVRLRFINASAMTFFDVRIPDLAMTVVQSDGNDVEPVTVDEFRIGVAETYDVIVEPKGITAYTIFAQAQDRTGYARATLATQLGMTAEVPPMDPRPVRTMADMGMSMAGMKGMSGMDMTGMKDGDQSRTKGSDMSDMKGMDMSNMSGMNMTGMKDGDQSDMKGMNMRGMDMAGMLMGDPTGTIPFPQPGPQTMPLHKGSYKETKFQPSAPVQLHPGPQVVGVAKHAAARYNDPGDGLNGNGRRVLTYADLRTRYRGVDGRPPGREIELHLTGNMERYIWGFNGKKFSDSKPIELKLGERVRFVLINDTMMDHPIHLHGLWSELENGHGEFAPYKHTVTVKPAERVSYLVSADTPGRWAFHCHLMYHMDSGMFRTVVVS
jgi:FtsP/CotA-like multicopper oxidase with cupredoxin domain